MLRVGCLVLACLAQDAPPKAEAEPPKPGAVRGTVTLHVPGLTLGDAGPVVAYLEGIDAPIRFAVPKAVPTISQTNARFAPSFLVIAAGQTVQFPNDDVIVHNVFSFSRPNDFDLGLYPKGESKSVTFRHPGVVRVYCSIHQSMSAVIYVAPSPHHTLVAADGAFLLRDVPPGRYRLRTWNGKLPSTAAEVTVAAGAEATVALAIEPKRRPTAEPRPGGEAGREADAGARGDARSGEGAQPK
jgi:plastocyanin